MSSQGSCNAGASDQLPAHAMPELLTSCQPSRQLEAGLEAVGALASGARALLAHQAPLACRKPPAKTQQSVSPQIPQENQRGRRELPFRMLA